MFKKILTTVLIFICLIPAVSAFHDINIEIPTTLIGGSTYQINISFQGEDIRIPYYINTTIAPIDTPNIWMNDFKLGDCNETMNGTFICEMLSQEGYNSYSLDISSNPALYPGTYKITVSMIGAMEIEDEDSDSGSSRHRYGGIINICGDGECGVLEDCESCPEDCGECEIEPEMLLKSVIFKFYKNDKEINILNITDYFMVKIFDENDNLIEENITATLSLNDKTAEYMFENGEIVAEIMDMEPGTLVVNTPAFDIYNASEGKIEVEIFPSGDGGITEEPEEELGYSRVWLFIFIFLIVLIGFLINENMKLKKETKKQKDNTEENKLKEG